MLELFPSLSVHPHAWDNENAAWMWHALRVVLQTLRKPIAARTADSETLLRGAAELALQRVEAGPIRTARNDREEDGVPSSDTAWLGALAVANEALVHPELIDSALLATRFGETVAAQWKLSPTEEQVDMLHNITFVRHWTRPGPLARLAEGALWTDAIDAGPLVAALALVPHLQEPERESVLRIALGRTALPKAEKLAQDIGGLLGEFSMIADKQGQRPALTTLSNESVSNPSNFPLLGQPETQRAFLSRFAFGMKTQAKHYAAHMELAADFGRWNLAAWRHLHRLPPANDHNTSGVSLFAHYWLSANEEVSHPLAIRLRWWQELTALRQEIVQEGSPRDLFHFYFLFRNGKLLDLCGTGEFFASVESLLTRMEPLLQSKLIALEQTSIEDADPRHWREALDHAVHAIDWFRASGGLDRPAEAEAAHRLLSRLCAPPFGNATAKDALHRLVS